MLDEKGAFAFDDVAREDDTCRCEGEMKLGVACISAKTSVRKMGLTEAGTDRGSAGGGGGRVTPRRRASSCSEVIALSIDSDSVGLADSVSLADDRRASCDGGGEG